MNVIITGICPPDGEATLDHLTSKLEKPIILITVANHAVRRWCFDKRLQYLIFHNGEDLKDMCKDADAVIAFVGGKIDDDTATILKFAERKGIKIKRVK